MFVIIIKLSLKDYCIFSHFIINIFLLVNYSIFSRVEYFFVVQIFPVPIFQTSEGSGIFVVSGTFLLFQTWREIVVSLTLWSLFVTSHVENDVTTVNCLLCRQITKKTSSEIYTLIHFFKQRHTIKSKKILMDNFQTSEMFMAEFQTESFVVDPI